MYFVKTIKSYTRFFLGKISSNNVGMSNQEYDNVFHLVKDFT